MFATHRIRAVNRSVEMRMVDVFDVTALQREVERRTKGAGLRVYFEDGLKQPYIGSGGMHLPMLHVPFDMDDFKVIRMLYIHELGHFFNKEAMDFRKAHPIDIKSNLGGVWNLLEDELDEKLSAEAYRGDAKALGEGHVIFLGRQLQWIKDNIIATGKKLKDDDIKRMAMYILAKETREWDEFAPPLCLQLRRTLPPEVATLTDTLVSEGWDDDIRKLRTAMDVVELAKRLHKRLWPEEPDAQEQLDKAAKDKADSEKGKAEAKAKSEDGDKDGDDGESDSSGELKGKETEGERAKVALIPWSKLCHSDHSSELLNSKQASFIDWTGKPAGRYPFKPATSDQFIEIQIYNRRGKL